MIYFHIYIKKKILEMFFISWDHMSHELKWQRNTCIKRFQMQLLQFSLWPLGDHLSYKYSAPPVCNYYNYEKPINETTVNNVTKVRPNVFGILNEFPLPLQLYDSLQGQLF